jgi:hypothetical protein
MGDVVAQQLKPLMVEQMRDVVPGAGEKIVHAQNLASTLQQPLAKM